MSVSKALKIWGKSFLRFARNQAGNATLITGLAAIPLVASAGLAIDYVRGTRAASELQSVTDSAALAAAAAKNVPGATSSAKLLARKQIAMNFLNAQLPKVQDLEVQGSPTVSVSPNTVDIQVNAKVKGSLINVLNGLASSAQIGGNPGGGAAGSSSKDIELTIRSKIGYTKENYTCLLALEPSAKQAIYFQGNSEFMATCGVMANSSHPTEAIRTWGNAYAEAESFCSWGGWMGSGFNPAPKKGCAPKADPYATLAMPAAGSCITAGEIPQATVHSSQGVTVKNTTATLKPGTYCKGLHIQTGGIANMEPGVYIIKDGTFDISSQSQVYATNGVVIYLTGSGSLIDVDSGAVFKLNAPTNVTAVTSTNPKLNTAPYKGFALIHDRTLATSGTPNSIYSKGGVDIQGAIYMPKQNLEVWANGDMNASSNYFPMVVNKLNMNGTATLYVKLDYATFGVPEPVELKNSSVVMVSQ